jgi:hypothetical protein
MDADDNIFRNRAQRDGMSSTIYALAWRRGMRCAAQECIWCCGPDVSPSISPAVPARLPDDDERLPRMTVGESGERREEGNLTFGEAWRWPRG